MNDEPQDQGEPQGHEAIVLATPATEDTGLKVHIDAFDGFDGDNVFGPMPWQPRYVEGATTVVIRYPQAGDRALVVFSDDGLAWCPCYWPQSF